MTLARTSIRLGFSPSFPCSTLSPKSRRVQGVEESQHSKIEHEPIRFKKKKKINTKVLYKLWGLILPPSLSQHSHWDQWEVGSVEEIKMQPNHYIEITVLWSLPQHWNPATSDLGEDTHRHCTTGKGRKGNTLFSGLSLWFVLWAIKCPGKFIPSQHNIKSEMNTLGCNLLKAKCIIRTHYSGIIIYR